MNNTAEVETTIYLDDNLTDEEARAFIDTIQLPHETEYYRPEFRENYPNYPTDNAARRRFQNRGPSLPDTAATTVYEVSEATPMEMSAIGRPPANAHFHSIRRFPDGSAWVRWECDDWDLGKRVSLSQPILRLH